MARQTQPQIANVVTKLAKRNLGLALCAIALYSCANPLNPTGSSSNNNLTAQQTLEGTLTNAKVTFNYNNFYTLTTPNNSGCAGDAKNYVDAVLGSSLQTSLLDDTTTIRPSFIKNISVDMTDTNTAVSSNLAQNCSYGSGANAPTPSNCATFDYGAVEGIDPNLSGSIVIIGGMNSSQAASGISEVSCSSLAPGSANSCPVSAYALAVDSLGANAATDPPNTLVPGLDSASGPISSWGSLTTSTSYAGPTSLTGAAGGYDVGTGLYALFGGVSQLPVTGALAQATSLDGTWIFDLKTQVWTNQASNPNVPVTFKETYDQEDPNASEELSDIPTARANFGYVAMPGISLSAMSTNGLVSSATVDTTDRIMIVGGQDASFNPSHGIGYVADAYKFNPTYGPELVDILGSSAYPSPTFSPAADQLVQWLGNYQSVLIEDGNAGSLFQINFPNPTSSGSSLPSSSFGATAIHNTTAPYAGYVLASGGFDSLLSNGLGGSPSDGCASGNNLCAMSISMRANNDEAHTANFTSVGNLPESVLTQNTEFAPTVWNSYQSSNSNAMFWYGGGSLLPGFDLANNDVVSFGGSTCSNYLVAGQSPCDFANPGGYYQMGTTPAASVAPTVPSPVPFASGSPPQAAGMATARGQDPSGNPIIVAFGGMTATGVTNNNQIYYMYNSGGNIASPAPVWKSVAATNPPNPVTNGSLVYSHVTGKFYLFGGFSPDQNEIVGDTWMLTVSGPTNCGTNGSCSFSWTQLDVADGLACSENNTCPAARRGHRMVEVNYNNTNPNAEPACSTASPCSFGLFMEGGTPDGVNELGDRWLFDPTANSGYGLWQKLADMPARTLAAMTSVDYTSGLTGQAAHRAVLFGGEMGLQNPLNALNAGGGLQEFVAGTLGDTWIYDYDTSTWNRVNLLGQGYKFNGSSMNGAFATELQNRQAYDATSGTRSGAQAHLSVLTPPPLAGAMMVTRTQSGPSGTVAASPLPMPEVFMVGGRKKDGSYNAFSTVYKFCIASTGEAYSGPTPGASPNTASSACDSYDPILNPLSPSPLNGAAGYSGRWLLKTPTAPSPSPAPLGSYLGAAAYDSYDDLVVVYGGFQEGSVFPVYDGTDSSVTNPSGRSFTSDVLEYTPPSTQTDEGAWTSVPVCAGSSAPTVRYGHSLSYDIKNQQLVVVGGYNAITGVPLTNSITAVNGTYNIPDVWTAKRNTSGGLGNYCYDWTQVSTFGNNATGVPNLADGLANFSALYVPNQGYGTGYYSMFDSSCIGSGPIDSPDPLQNKLYAGGVYFDIDRTQLGTYENLILNLTFLPLGPTNQSPTINTMTSADTAVFQVDLVTTGQSNSALEAVLQPRFLTYTDNNEFPTVVQTLSVLAPPTGQIRQEQMLIPLSVNPSIDRIHIKRVSGSGILIDASLFRLGAGEN